jgi:hypothetical protein
LFGLEIKIIFSKHNFEVNDLLSKFTKDFRSSQNGKVMTLPSPFIDEWYNVQKTLYGWTLPILWAWVFVYVGINVCFL